LIYFVNVENLKDMARPVLIVDMKRNALKGKHGKYE